MKRKIQVFQQMKNLLSSHHLPKIYKTVKVDGGEISEGDRAIFKAKEIRFMKRINCKAKCENVYKIIHSQEYDCPHISCCIVCDIKRFIVCVAERFIVCDAEPVNVKADRIGNIAPAEDIINAE